MSPHRCAERGAVSLGLLLGLALLAVCIFVLPGLILTWDLRGTGLAPPNTPEALLKSKNDIRTTLLQAFSALLVVATAYSAWSQYRLTRVGQFSERFEKAIIQLGHEKLDVRRGGIHALALLGRESPRDREGIIGILADFVRGRSPWVEPGAPLAAGEPLKSRAPDVQAALDALKTVIAYAGDEAPPLHLENVDLRRADLEGARLEGARLRGAHLEGARLQGARFRGATLEQAHFNDSHLEGASLVKVQARGAQFSGARLASANLFEAELEGACFENAELRAADLRKAQLGGADLRGAIFIGVKNLDKAVLMDALASHGSTKWPDGFESGKQQLRWVD